MSEELASALPTVATPYIGPRPFRAAEHEYFFGREREARDLLSLVIAERLTLFYAQSGAGKSSLINTRLLPGLRKAGFTPLPVSRVSGTLPAAISGVRNIYLFNLLLSLLTEQQNLAPLATMSLIDCLANLASDDGEHFYLSAATTPTAVPPAPPTTAPSPDNGNDETALEYTTPAHVLIVDQFEELFTTHADRWPERADFFRQLQEAQERDPLLWVVLVMREDFVAELDPYTNLLSDKLRIRYYMQRMGLTAAKQAIQQPARKHGRPFTDDALTALVDNLSRIRVMGQRDPLPGQYVEPVQLQVVCLQLWANLQSRPPGPITIDDLQEAGDVDRALADYYEQSLRQVQARLPGLVSESALRDWFSKRLITESGTRGLVNQGATTTGGLPNAVVQLLDTERYLVRRESRAGSLWVELVHDRFVPPIQEANRAWSLAQNNPVSTAARLWRENNRDPHRLLRGATLNNTKQYAQEHPDELGEEEHHFLEASVRQSELEAAVERQRSLELAQAEAERERYHAARLRAFVRRLVALALLSLLATVFAIFQYTQANLLKNQLRVDQIAFVARSLAIESNLPQRGLLLAVEAANGITPSRLSAQQTLHSLLGQTGGYTYAKYTDRATSVAFSPDGKRLASSSYDNMIRLWQVDEPNSEPLILSGHTSVVLSVAFSPDGKLLAGGSVDNTIRLWQVNKANTEPLILRGHDAAVRAVAFSPDGKLLASASYDKTIRLWRVNEANAEPRILRSHDAIMSMAFSPDGMLLASGSWDNTIRLWRVNEANTEPHILRGHDAIMSVAFSPDGKLLASGGEDNTIRLWQVDEPNVEPIIFRGHSDVVLAVAFSPDGKQLVSGSWDNTIRLWQVNEANTEPLILRGHDAGVRGVAFSPNGKLLASRSEDKTIRLWQLNEANSDPFILRGHDDGVMSVAFSPDGKQLASGSWDNTIRLWQVNEANKEPFILRGHDAAIRALTFSPDGKLLASGSEDKTIRLWQVNEANTEPLILRGHDAAIRAVAFSPNGKLLASASYDKTIRLWQVNEANTEPLVLRGHDDGVMSVAFSPDGKLLASGSEDETIRLWQVNEANTEPLILRGHDDGVMSVAFSPDGKLLASGSWDNTIRLWQVNETNTEPFILRDHTYGVVSVAFSPDGKLLASGSEDNTIRLWQANEANTEPLIFRGHTNTVLSVAFSPDNKLLASGSWDTKVNLWHVQTEDLVTLACQVAGRNLGREEWEQYFPGEAYRRTCAMWPDGTGIADERQPTPPLPLIPTTLLTPVAAPLPLPSPSITPASERP
jgi:WD40 repeat protein